MLCEGIFFTKSFCAFLQRMNSLLTPLLKMVGINCINGVN